MGVRRGGGDGVAEGRESRLLLVVVLAVKFPLSEVTAGGERLLTHGALQTLLVPRRVVHPHQEAVGDGTLASFAHRRMMAVGPWEKKKNIKRKKEKADEDRMSSVKDSGLNKSI